MREACLVKKPLPAPLNLLVQKQRRPHDIFSGALPYKWTQESEYVSSYYKDCTLRNHPAVEFPLNTACIIPAKTGNVYYKELTPKMCVFKSKYQNTAHVENH